MKLTGVQIRSLIEKKEDERVEFKRASSELPDNMVVISPDDNAGSVGEV